MYLRKKRYVMFNDELRQEERFQAFAELLGEKPEAIKEIEVEGAYWRKANQIHGWFVKNVQDGVDECQPSYVSEEQLTELLELCHEAWMHHAQDVDDGDDWAHNNLPPTDGFFFGSSTIDQYYWEDIEATIKQLTPIVESFGKDEHKWVHYEYQSSW